MPEFTVDWFSHHAPNWQSLFKALEWEPSRPYTVVEVGSFEGRSTLWLLETLLAHPDSRIHCVDTFAGGVEHDPNHIEGLYDRFSRNIAAHAAKVSVHRDLSWRALHKLVGEGVQADLVYIDGSHQAPDVLEDLVLGFRLLKVGGAMICDDYIWSAEPMPQHDVLNAPKIAIDAFTTINRRRMTLVNGRMWQVMMVKIAE